MGDDGVGVDFDRAGPMIGKLSRRSGEKRRRHPLPVVGAVALSILAPLGLVLAATPAGAPTFVDIGNGTQLVNGTYLNAQNIANDLAFTSVHIQGTSSITIVDPVDLSTSVSGTPHFSLFLTAPTINIDNNLNLGPTGSLVLAATTLNLNAQITSGGTTISPSRVASGATQVNVLKNAASIQQGADLSSATAPVVVQVSPGQYAENVTIAKSGLTLSGVDGTAPAGADPTAPTINGTQPGGNVVTVTSNGVKVDGLDLNGKVNGGSSTPSVDGIYASGVDSLTLSHNTIDSFSGLGIETPSSTNVTLNGNAIIPTAVTSAAATTFTEGAAGAFTVTTTGTPAAALSESGGLPSGVTFHDNGDGTATLAGTPASGTAGSYPLTITTSNGISPDASQNFTLTVNAAPTITSASSTTFVEGVAGSFGVASTASPTASLQENGQLPNGVTFHDNGDGTGTLAGTPASETAGLYSFTITASNGVGSDAVQNFALTVGSVPVITSPTSYTFTQGSTPIFTVAATGYPAPTFTDPGPLDGLTIDPGTGSLTGTPTTSGSFTSTITASNGISPADTQSFTLNVNAPPVFTSANHATFTKGHAGSIFTPTASGFPVPTITKTAGTLPSGVSFTGGQLKGTPTVGGTFHVTFTASNGVLPSTSQAFTLTVNQVPAFTSAKTTTFTHGVKGTFHVTAVGPPTPGKITESGKLPSGVTLTSSGGGTGTLAGKTSAKGTFSVTFKVTDSVGTTTQTLTLIVK